MNTPQRIYRTEDGELVAEGDLKAAYLAYGLGDEVENRDADKVKALLGEDKKPATKKAAASANKAAAKPADK